MTINPAFEDYITNDGEHTYDHPAVTNPRYSKVRPYSLIYLS